MRGSFEDLSGVSMHSGSALGNKPRDAIELVLARYHESARGRPGLFILSHVEPQKSKATKKPRLHPLRFGIGDHDAMADEARRRAIHSNIYFGPALMRPDISRGSRGKKTDITAVLSLVLEEDGDTDKLVTMPPGIDPTFEIATSNNPTLNRHFHFLYDEPLSPKEALELAELAYRKCGGDSCGKDIAHIWRLPNTLNHPCYRKIERGRPPGSQAVKLIGGTGKPVSVKHLRAALLLMPDRYERVDRAELTQSFHGGPAGNRDEIIQILPSWLVSKINREGTDRSKHCADVMLSLFKEGLSDGEVLSVASGAHFARKYDARGDLVEEISRLRAVWISEGSPLANEGGHREKYENTYHQGALKTRKSTSEGFEGGRRGAFQKKVSPGEWTKSDWPNPEQLPDDLPPVRKFSWDLLPTKLEPWCRDITELMQCPPDFVGVAAMTALGTVVGRKVGIRPQRHTPWTEFSNLWAMLIGRPGIMKSPAMEAALWPLKQLMQEAVKEHNEQLRDYRIKKVTTELSADAAKKAAKVELKKNLKADISELLKQEEIEEPVLRRHVTNDTTFASLVEIHRQNPNGILEYRDEIISLLALLDREDHAEARAFRLTGWGGNSPYTTDRIGRGSYLHIPGVCLSVLGSTQPGRASNYLRHAVKGGAGDDGLLQRFGMMVWPDASIKWNDVDRVPDTAGRQKALEIFKWLDQVTADELKAHQPEDHNGNPFGVPYLRFDDLALEIFRSWRTCLEERLRSGELHPAMESHLSKYRKLVPALALLCHLGEGETGPVSEVAVSRAIAWAEYLESHANRAYASVTMGKVATAKAILKRIRSGDLTSPFKSRDIYHKGWSRLGDRNEVTGALELLTDFHYLADCEVRTGGRPRTDYYVNPKGLPA